jgi:hypothetical protein
MEISQYETIHLGRISHVTKIQNCEMDKEAAIHYPLLLGTTVTI